MLRVNLGVSSLKDCCARVLSELSFDVDMHCSLIFRLAFPDKPFSGKKIPYVPKHTPYIENTKRNPYQRVLCSSLISFAPVYTHTQSHSASRRRSLTYLANGILGCHMWQNTESRKYYELWCVAKLFHRRHQNLIECVGVSAACFLTCLVTNLSFMYFFEHSAPSRYARPCCLQCHHGHGPPIGRAYKTCFLSTHNGFFKNILKPRFKIIAKKLETDLLFLATILY